MQYPQNLERRYLKTAMDQNYEKEINLFQRAYMLTWFSLWSIHNK